MENKKNESQVSDLQMVEIDRNKFAIQMTEGNINVNLTKMAQPFGSSKRPANWLKTKESKEYINSLSDALKIASVDLLRVKKGNFSSDEQGTWANDYRIAMRFAQWLDPKFAIKVDEMLVSQLLKQKVKEPLAIPQNAGFVENQVYISKLGDMHTQCYYTNGMVFTKLSVIMRYFGYTSGYSSYFKDRLGAENLLQIEVGNQMVWFGNINAIDRLLKHSHIEIKYSLISAAYRDVFGIERSSEHEPYNYRFTDSQMLEIFELIFDKPINKDKVIVKLKNGKGGI